MSTVNKYSEILDMKTIYRGENQSLPNFVGNDVAKLIRDMPLHRGHKFKELVYGYENNKIVAATVIYTRYGNIKVDEDFG